MSALGGKPFLLMLHCVHIDVARILEACKDLTTLQTIMVTFNEALTAGSFFSAAFEGACATVQGASGGVFGMMGLFIADLVLNFETVKRSDPADLKAHDLIFPGYTARTAVRLFRQIWARGKTITKSSLPKGDLWKGRWLGTFYKADSNQSMQDEGGCYRRGTVHVQATAAWAAHACLPNILHHECSHIYRSKFCLVSCRRLSLRSFPFLPVPPQLEEWEMGTNLAYCWRFCHPRCIHWLATVLL